MASETSTVRAVALDLGADRADALGMLRPDQRRPELLVLYGDPNSIVRLRELLEDQGAQLDAAKDLAEMRAAFFSRGGHDVLILTPDLPVQIAERAARALRDLDRDVAIVAFGRELTRAKLPESATRLPEFHPTSRAGIGAILRVFAANR